MKITVNGVAQDVRKPKCKMVGEDGNVFAVIGRVSRALKAAGQKDRSAEWQAKAFACDSYDAVLQLMFQYVDAY